MVRFVSTVVVRGVTLAAFLLLATHAPLFSCYGFGTGKNKVRLAPASYFVLGLEQTDAVKRSRRLKGMVRDLGTALHVPGELADDWGLPVALARAGQYLPIWKTKAKRMQNAGGNSKKKNKRRRKKGGDGDGDDDNHMSKKHFMDRARKWRDELDDVKTIAKGDYLGVAAAGIICLSSFPMLLAPGAAQFALLGTVGMMTGVTRRNLPNMTMEKPFYIICGLLLFVILWQSMFGDGDRHDSKKGLKGKKKRKGPSMRRPKSENGDKKKD